MLRSAKVRSAFLRSVTSMFAPTTRRGCAVLIVGNDAAGLDPSHLAARPDDPVVAMMLGAPCVDIAAQACVQARQILRVNPGSPLDPDGLLGSLGQTVNGDIARRDFHAPRAEVVREAAHEGGFSRQGKLCIALDQRPICQLPIRDVVGDAEQAHGNALRVAQDRPLDRNPTRFTGVWMAGRMYHPVFRVPDTPAALLLLQRQHPRALRSSGWTKRRPSRIVLGSVWWP